MPKIPMVAIIGRPNAGKSSLFNALINEQHAIVTDIAGTTRDQVARHVEGETVDYLLVDTAGIGGGSTDRDLEDDVALQSAIAIESADVILFCIPCGDELTLPDRNIIEILRKKRRKHVPVVIVATKADRNTFTEEQSGELSSLGITDDVIPVSAVHRKGIQALQQVTEELLRGLHFKKEESDAAEESTIPRIAIVGKPNVGKSSLLNAFMSDPNQERTGRLVSDIPGTTRDPSDTIVRFHEKEYIFVDTAGIRQKSQMERGIESLSHLKSLQAIAGSDLVLLILDAKEPTSRQDKRIANIAVTEGKGLIILLNKSDTLTGEERKERKIEAEAALHFCKFAPMLFCSAKTKDGLLKIFPLIEMVAVNRARRIVMKDLRRWYDDTIQQMPSRVAGKSKHLTQASEVPPTFILFTRDPKSIKPSELKFLERRLRETFAFEGTPIRWISKLS